MPRKCQKCLKAKAVVRAYDLDLCELCYKAVKAGIEKQVWERRYGFPR